MKRVELQEIAEVKFCIVSTAKRKTLTEAKWITLSALMPYNEMGECAISSEYEAQEDLRARRYDILIKRISPTGVNWLDEDPNAYVYNNLILVRAKEGVEASYLAAYLDNTIEEYVKARASGTKVLALGRKDISEMPIELPSMSVQRAVGQYWVEYNRKKRLESKLSVLEQKRNKEIIQRIRTYTGGQQ